MTRSPLLEAPGAIGHPDGDDARPDGGVASHFGDPFAEQRAATRRAVVVDRSHRGLVVVTGADRLSWLHLLVSQQVADLPEGAGTEGLVLDVQGRVEHHAVISHVDGGIWLDVEPGTAEALAAYLTSMTFWSAVEVRDATAEYAMLSLVGPDTAEVLTAGGVELPTTDAGPLSGGGIVRRKEWPADAVDLVVPRDALRDWWERLRGAGATPAGLDAFEALRVTSLRPRLGLDTDDRTIPHEVGWIGSAVHLSKGCYRGQETVSRVANLGRPPRQMVLLHLASGDDALPPPGTPVLTAEGGRAVGRIGTAVRHHELGTVALALVKRSAVVAGTELWVADDREEGTPGPATVDPDSVPPDTGEPPGRAAVRRLQG
ncbi:folate-binding protein [Actinomycetospora sp. NBRC 106378]|uniref:CAF17-like 4Fe-4S cluster assembly/insertion protein YgfZ n=1 Tax=Actinomycetospora sp. NBRC 106378 TaxID=3032208 RepID=UPI0024A5FF3F|nr:folate-binding protein [Actinomycetospora sp. NBRC 106378]GLZ51127.1 glycine cleavage system protein T [Actinomycetospora sp. NBRC 106378]